MIKVSLPLRGKCPNTELLDTPYSVRMRENTAQKKLRIWKLFTQCSILEKIFAEFF